MSDCQFPKDILDEAACVLVRAHVSSEQALIVFLAVMLGLGILHYIYLRLTWYPQVVRDMQNHLSGTARSDMLIKSVEKERTEKINTHIKCPHGKYLDECDDCQSNAEHYAALAQYGKWE